MAKYKMNREELSLLLYLETRAVDHGGRVSGEHMNGEDYAIAKKWNDEGLLDFGRIASEDVTSSGGSYVIFNDKVFELAHAERKARAKRMLKKRVWKSIKEKRDLL